MDRDALTDELRGVIGDYLKNKGLDLVEISCRRQGRDLALQILADRPEGGISLGDCASLNREIGTLLDEKDIIKESYVLEVSSPGLDRPLRTKNDFSRCINKRVRVFLNEQVNGRMEFEGIIKRIEDAALYIEAREETIEIPFSKITKAKQIV